MATLNMREALREILNEDRRVRQFMLPSLSLSRSYQVDTFNIPFTTTTGSFQPGEVSVKETVQSRPTFSFVTRKESDFQFISPEGEPRVDRKFEVSIPV